MTDGEFYFSAFNETYTSAVVHYTKTNEHIGFIRKGGRFDYVDGFQYLTDRVLASFKLAKAIIDKEGSLIKLLDKARGPNAKACVPYRPIYYGPSG